MSVASRITSMTEHIQNAYDSIERFGVDTESIDKNLVNLSNTITNEIYDKLPKVSGNGSNFTLENVQKGKLDLFEMEGNTYQDSYSGINLLPKQGFSTPSNDTSYWANQYDMLTPLENGWGRVVINDSSSSQRWFNLFIKKGNIDLEPNTQYTFVVEIKNVSGFTAYKLSQNNVSEVWSRDINANMKVTTQQKFLNQTKSDFSNLDFDLRTFLTLPANKTGTIDIRMMILKGDYTNIDIDYEKFVGGIPSPNPEYPQDIEVVTGDNTINVHGKNLFDKDNVNTLNSYISLGNGKITSSNADKCLYIPIKSNTTYTISKILSSRFVIGCTDELPVVNTTICNPISGNQATNTTYTITSGNNSQYLVVFYYTTSDTLTEQQILDSIQIEEGSTATAYEPYQSKDYEINLGSIELCKIGDYQDYIYNDNEKWYIYKLTRKIELNISEIGGSENYPTFYNVSQLKQDYPNQNTPTFRDLTKYITNISGISTTGNAIGVNTIGKSGSIILNKSFFNLTNIQWKEQHPNLVLVLYYGLQTPEITPITDTTLIEQLEAIETETGTNIFEVSNDNDVLPSLNVKRLKELEKLS